MKTIMPEFIQLFFLAAITAPTVTYAVEIKVSVPHVQVPHLAVPHASTPVRTPHVNTGAGAHITVKARVRHLSKGSISGKSDKSSQANNKALQDQVQQLKMETNQKQEESKLEGAMEQQQDQLTQQISKETFSILNKIDPAAKASVVFVDQENLKSDNANTALGTSPRRVGNITNGIEKGGAPGAAQAATLVTSLASSNGLNSNFIRGSTSNGSNGGGIFNSGNGGPSSNASNGGGIFNSGNGGPSSNASNGGGIFNNGAGGPSSNASETLMPPGGVVMGIYSAKDSSNTTTPRGEKVSGGYKIFKPKKYDGPNLHNKPNDVSIEHLELSNERILIGPH